MLFFFKCFWGIRRFYLYIDSDLILFFNDKGDKNIFLFLIKRLLFFIFSICKELDFCERFKIENEIKGMFFLEL